MAKRKRSDTLPACHVAKKQKQTTDNVAKRKRNQHETSFSTIGRLYEHVLSLKDYILQALPSGSKLRVKRILSFREHSSGNAHFIDQTLVAFSNDVVASDHIDHRIALKQFTQTQRAAKPGSAASQRCTLDEVS